MMIAARLPLRTDPANSQLLRTTAESGSQPNYCHRLKADKQG
jgi:hypothetical protein